MIFDEEKNEISAKRVSQNNQDFLIGTFSIGQVSKFAKFTEHLLVDVEEVSEEDKIFNNQKQFKPVYLPQIQRKVNNSKVEKIADYLIHDPAAMFPTNIVIAIPHLVIDSIQDDSQLTTISLNSEVTEEIKANGVSYLTIIDGQHRIRGIETAIKRLNVDISNAQKILLQGDSEEIKKELEKNQKLLQRLLSFQLLVTFFIDPTLEYQAMVFATINKTQTRVPENLVYSLFGLTKKDSPQKTALEIVLALNGLEKSPFYKRVKLVGSTYKRGTAAPLSQATMVKSILFNICKNEREAEKERHKERLELKSNPNNLAFRKFYANSNDKKIIRIIYAYYSAVRDTFKNNEGVSLWNLEPDQKPSNILQTNVGYQALLKVLIDIMREANDAQVDNVEFYKEKLAKANDLDFEDKGGEEPRYPFTSKTINLLYTDIANKVIL